MPPSPCPLRRLKNESQAAAVRTEALRSGHDVSGGANGDGCRSFRRGERQLDVEISETQRCVPSLAIAFDADRLSTQFGSQLRNRAAQPQAAVAGREHEMGFGGHPAVRIPTLRLAERVVDDVPSGCEQVFSDPPRRNVEQTRRVAFDPAIPDAAIRIESIRDISGRIRATSVLSQYASQLPKTFPAPGRGLRVAVLAQAPDVLGNILQGIPLADANQDVPIHSPLQAFVEKPDVVEHTPAEVYG